MSSAPRSAREAAAGHAGSVFTVTRRHALRMIGAGGAAAVGGTLLTGCNSATPTAHAAATAATSPASAVNWGPPITTPAGYAPSSIRATWSQRFQAGHGWKATGEGTASAALNDTQTFLTGQQSVRVTTTGKGMPSSISTTGMPPVDLTGKMLRLTFRVDDVTHLHSISFHAGTGELDDQFTWVFHTHDPVDPGYVQSGEWVVVDLQWADITSASGRLSLSKFGVPSATTGFTAMSFTAQDDGTGPVTYHLQSIEALPDTRTTFPNGAVSITFDDSWGSVYDLALPEMSKRGFSGTIYNIAEAAGTPRYLTTAQMRSMQDNNGWEMAGHAYSMEAHNAGYNALTAAQVETDMGKLHDWLVSNSFSTENFAYPHGAFTPTTDGVPVDTIANRHFATARSIIGETIESFIPAMPYRLKALTGLNDGNGIGGPPLSTVTAIGARLDRCAANGAWQILCLHEIVDGAPTVNTEISRTGLAAVLNAIADRGIPVITVSEAMKHYA